jgi:hypothetical protein
VRKWLIPLSVFAGLAIGVPASGQYFFLDVSGDGASSLADRSLPGDALHSGVTSVDVYVVTDRNRDGSEAVCSSAEPFTINQYEFTLHTTGNGSVAFHSWTDNMGFDHGLVRCGDATMCSGGPDVWVGRGSTSQLAPGKYRLGTLGVTVTGTPRVAFVTSSGLDPYAQTGFGTNCDGLNFDSLVRLGLDLTDADGTEEAVPVIRTTWNDIKKLYSN